MQGLGEHRAISTLNTVDAIIKSREAALHVVKAIAIIDREESNGAQRIQDSGVPFNALLSLKSLIHIQATLGMK